MRDTSVISEFPEIPVTLTDEIIAELLTVAAEQKTTDLHFSRGHLYYRSHGELLAAQQWRKFTDDESRVREIFSSENLKALLIKEKIGDERSSVPGRREHQRTVMYRAGRVQVRVQLLNTEQGDHIAIRVQENRPPSLAEVLKHSPETQRYLSEKPEGLVLVTGPMGSGKTTLAASLAESWTRANRHLVTLEDPVEYVLTPSEGIISHLPCNFRDEAALDDSIEDLLRSDMDALFVGEIRHVLALRTCLEFAGMREPVITTIHGGSIAHSLIRLFTVAGKNMTEAALKRSLAQCLHAVVYVNLAFTKYGRPVPVVMCLPGNPIEVRQIIAEENPEIFGQKVEGWMKSNGSFPGVINHEAALNNAVAMGATRESALAALP
jgi:twitching motility protein PilT